MSFDCIISKVIFDKEELSKQIDEFFTIHNELYLYGFAIGIDYYKNFSLNFYLAERD